MIRYERLFEETGILVNCCAVQPGLAEFLTGEEIESMRNCTNAVQDRAAAARLAARELLAQEGYPEWSMARKHGDAPDWPTDWTGSLSHSDDFAAAALVRRGAVESIGIDIEPAEPLPIELRETVVVAGDHAGSYPPDIVDRIIFCAKEASYKAVYPIDRRFLNFNEMMVDLDTGFAMTSYGRSIKFLVHVDYRIVVLAQLTAIVT
jgi:4'-phosphopantetheinyl transferase EntD